MMIKRIFDMSAAVLLFIPAVFICMVSAVAIWVEIRTNPIFSQWRVGRNQQLFKIFKLRTMPPSTPDVPSHSAETGSITRVGSLLRRLKIDELPQLWCVLRGEMSLVGPRPCLPIQRELIEERELRGVFRVRPGITGLAQIRGVDMSRPTEVAIIDAAYVADYSIANDLLILLKTLIGDGRGDAVCRKGS